MMIIYWLPCLITLVSIRHAHSSGPPPNQYDDVDLGEVQMRHPGKASRDHPEYGGKKTRRSWRSVLNRLSGKRSSKEVPNEGHDAAVRRVSDRLSATSLSRGVDSGNDGIASDGKKARFSKLKGFFNGKGSRKSGELFDQSSSSTEHSRDATSTTLRSSLPHMVTTEELQRGLSTLNEVSAESTMDWDAADRTTQGMGDSHADLPADVYCNYHSGHALCLAKIPDSDFVDIFHHNFAKKSTKSCGVSTFPSFEPDGEALSRLPGENEKAWEKAMKQLKGKKSWQAPADQELLNQFRHLIFHTCDIEIEGTSFGVTALYIKPMEDQKLSVAFFTEPEKVAVVWEFERHELVVPGHQRTYISMDPPFEVELAHKRAKVTVAGERIQGVVFTRKNIFTLPGESYRSKNQILCFRFSWTTEAIAVMKYGEKWAFMMSEKETT